MEKRSEPTIVGRAFKAKWYVIKEGDATRVVSFHTVFLDRERESFWTFPSDSKTYPAVELSKFKVFDYSLIRNASDDEVAAWFEAHSDVRLLEIEEMLP